MEHMEIDDMDGGEAVTDGDHYVSATSPSVIAA
jgi:hypothetical protein